MSRSTLMVFPPSVPCIRSSTINPGSTGMFLCGFLAFLGRNNPTKDRSEVKGFLGCLASQLVAISSWVFRSTSSSSAIEFPPNWLRSVLSANRVLALSSGSQPRPQELLKEEGTQHKTLGEVPCFLRNPEILTDWIHPLEAHNWNFTTRPYTSLSFSL